MVDVADEDLPADFGKYRLVKRIATGGMAEIFLAHERARGEGEPLVIKRILPHLGKSGDFVSMFLDEARIAAQLTHPNIVGIRDIGQIDGAYFLAMEYVHGEDIRRIYNRAYKLQRSLPLSHSIRVIADAALGLGYAHKLCDFTGRPLGMVHRDVSPQNILVTYDGDAKVVDFGIAKAANKVAQTRAGVLKGKYSYMSPEQALGDAIDHRTDIFALGIILYETTTGTRLFKRHNELATLQAIIKCEFAPPSEVLPNYPLELEQVLLRALTRRPEDRYQDAEELSAALYDFLHESGLYVEREVVAEFMSDLFADRLESEEGTGQPVLPEPEEVREELGGTSRMKGPRAPESLPPEHVPPSRGPGTAVERSGRLPPPHPEDDVDSPGTTPEADWEDLEHRPQVVARAESVPDARSQRRKSTEVIRQAEEVLEHPDPAEAPLADDLAPTVAAHPSYRPPVRSPAPSDRPRRSPGEPTERIARRRVQDARQERPALAADPSGGARPPREPPRSWLLAAVIGTAVLVAILAGVLVSRLLGGREGEPARSGPAASARAGTGRVVFFTEPGATVFVNGDPVATAGPDGEAGPLELAPGELVVRVTHEALGFERQRALAVEAGQNYQVEIRARHGWLRLAVAPWARVTIDGKEFGLTPLPKISLLEGAHRVVLENADIGRRHRATVRILAGEEIDLKVDLRDSGERM